MLNTPDIARSRELSPADPIGESLDLELLDRRMREERDRRPDIFELMNQQQEETKAAYDELISLGGRPTRSIREEPPYKTSTLNDDGYYELFDEEKGVWYHSRPEHLMPHHWGRELGFFKHQLSRWTEFREQQAKSNDDCSFRNHLLLRPTNLRALESDDPVLTQKLTLIHDWRAYHSYRLTKVTPIDRFRTICRNEVSRLNQACLDLADPPQIRNAQYQMSDWARKLNTANKKWQVEKKILVGIETETSKILEECVNEFGIYNPNLLAKVSEDATRTVQYLSGKLEGLSGSCWPTRSPLDSSSELEKLLHWESEVFRFAELYAEWRESLRLMQENHDPMDENVIYILDTEPNAIRNRKLWEAHLSHHEEKLQQAEEWVACWKRIKDHCADHRGEMYLVVWREISFNYEEIAREDWLAATALVPAAAEALKNAQTETSEALHELDQANVKLPKCPWGTPSEWVDSKIIRKRKAVEDAPGAPAAKRVCLDDEVTTTTDKHGTRNKATASTPISRNQPNEHADGASASPVYPTPPSTGSSGSAGVPAVVQDASPLAASSVLPKPRTSNGRRGRRTKNTDRQNLNKNAHVPGAPRYDFRPRTFPQEGPTTPQSTLTPSMANGGPEASENRASKRVQRSKPSNRSSHGQVIGTNKLGQRSKPMNRSSNGQAMGTIESSQDQQAVDVPNLRRSSRVQKQKGRWAPY